MIINSFRPLFVANPSTLRTLPRVSLLSKHFVATLKNFDSKKPYFYLRDLCRKLFIGINFSFSYYKAEHKCKL